MEVEEIRTRFAPSPTGPFHIGAARTALFNWIFAKKHEGQFILRIEDTDKERSKEKWTLDIEESLAWLGLDWDEGPDSKDNFGPYLQSKRSKIYQKYADKLLAEKKAYWCYCKVEELEKERLEQEKKHLAPRYSGKCCNLNKTQIKKFESEGRKPALRFKVSPEKVKFKDLIRGEVQFDAGLFGDFVIMKSDGTPTFLFAGVIDDALMEISHVIRGEDHISNTPKQILLGQALNLLEPYFAHIPLILNPDRTKLSKRKNPTSVTADFRDKGYLPDALINFMALMGWSPKTKNEIFSLDELITEFSIEEIGKSPSIFDLDKLNYLNGFYIRKMPLGELARQAFPYLEKAGFVKKEDPRIIKALYLVQDRIKKIAEAPELVDFVFRAPKFEKDLLITKGSSREETLKALESVLFFLEKETDFSRDSMESILRALAQKINLKAGNVLWPIRVALTGKKASPGAFEVLEVLGKAESLKRIKSAVDMLK